jgi:cathepsin L
MFGLSKAMVHERRALKDNTAVDADKYRSELFKSRALNFTEAPDSFDWVALGATTEVKNQGACGSCWAFAGTEAIESDVFLETGQLLTLAPQPYVDCVENPQECGGTGGCSGATCDLLFEYATHHGATLEQDYPYRANDGQCSSYIAQASIQAWVDVAVNNETAHMEAVLLQPITISVAASPWALYFGGVFSYDECGTDINHAVLLVGYGTDPVGGDYWKVQNSWGPSWGENGFIRLQRSTQCGIDTKPLDGTGCKGGPPEVTVCGTCGMYWDSVYPIGGGVTLKRN